MENVFADLNAEIKTNYSKEEKAKLKRHAFIFINAEPDANQSAVEDLKKVEGVIELYSARGSYDIIAKVSGESLDHLREKVLKQIKNLKSIKSTLTLMVI